MKEDIYLNGIKKLAKKYKKWILIGSLIIKVSRNKLVNRSVLIDKNGRVRTYYDKIHMYNVVLSKKEKYFESKTFLAGNKIKSFKLPWGQLGFSICYDLRFPELFRMQHKDGVETFILPAAFTEQTGRVHWETLVKARAIENLCYLVTSCQDGYHISGRQTHGNTMIVNPWGQVLKRLQSGNGFIESEINRKQLQSIREKFPVLDHIRLLEK